MKKKKVMLKHFDVCSGIGGFALGFRWAELSEPVAFCEIDEYCQKVLAKNFPNIPIFKDLKELVNEKPEPESTRTIPDHDILTAGYPCQPFSVAGKRRGEEDPRNIWPYVYEIVKRKHPTWCVFENVYGHVAMGLDKVLNEMEMEGYSTQTFIVPACSLNAPHLRNRLWIVAHSNCKLNIEQNTRGYGEEKEIPREHRTEDNPTRESSRTSSTRKSRDGYVADSNNNGHKGRCVKTRNETSSRQNTQSKWRTNTEVVSGQSNDGGDKEESTVDESLRGSRDDCSPKSSSTIGICELSTKSDNDQRTNREDRYQKDNDRTLVSQRSKGVQSSKYRGLGKDKAFSKRDKIRQGDDYDRNKGMEDKKSDVADTSSTGLEGQSEHGPAISCSGEKRSESRSEISRKNAMADTQCMGREPRSKEREEFTGEESHGESDHRSSNGSKEEEARSWWDVEPNVGRVAYGVSSRVDRLKGLGNAIVPQIAMQIGLAIKEAMND